jgi:parallel beta-helix repeat protein
LIVDGGTGYVGATAIDLFASSAGSSYAMEVNGAHVMGSWRRAPVNMGFNRDSTFRNVVVDSGTGAYAFDLQNAIGPTVENCRVLGGDYGISLGDTTGARLRNNRLNVAVAKYDTTGSRLSDFVIEDADPGRIAVVADYTVAPADRYLGVDTTAPRSISLVYARRFPAGALLTIKDETGMASSNSITIGTAGTDRFEDNTPVRVVNANFGVIRLMSNGTKWLVL